MSDEKRILRLLADLSENPDELQRAIENAPKIARFAKTQLDIPGIKESDPEYYGLLCDCRRQAEELMDVTQGAARDGGLGDSKVTEKIGELYGNLSSSIKEFFRYMDGVNGEAFHRPLLILAGRRL